MFPLHRTTIVFVSILGTWGWIPYRLESNEEWICNNTQVRMDFSNTIKKRSRKATWAICLYHHPFLEDRAKISTYTYLEAYIYFLSTPTVLTKRYLESWIIHSPPFYPAIRYSYFIKRICSSPRFFGQLDAQLILQRTSLHDATLYNHFHRSSALPPVTAATFARKQRKKLPPSSSAAGRYRCPSRHACFASME